MTESSKQRIYAALMTLGAGVLLFRTLRMMFLENAFGILVEWAASLLILEFLIDLGCMVSSVRWLITDNKLHATLPVRLGAMACILHAIRVLIYVLGRTGPWVNFDVKPEIRSSYTFEWFWVYFAAILSFLGIVGVIVIWRMTRHKKN